MKKFFKSLQGFSLVELMISLIVISIVTAAFTPILTKKLKTTDQTIGTASSTSIVSTALCNSISTGCLECESDKCLASDYDKGYFLNEATGKSQSCNSVLEGCAKCSSATKCDICDSAYTKNGTTCTPCTTGCLNCVDGYFLNGSNCSKCSNHCTKCTNLSACNSCDSGYFLTDDKYCWKYECDSSICYLVQHDNKVLSIYRYNLGEGALSSLSPMGIYSCTAGASCSYGSSEPVCYKVSFMYGRTAQGACVYNPLNSSYSRCSRALCNGYATLKADVYLKTKGWHVFNYSDYLKVINAFNGMVVSNVTIDPFPYSSFATHFLEAIDERHDCVGGAQDNRCCSSFVYWAAQDEAGQLTYGLLNQTWGRARPCDGSRTCNLKVSDGDPYKYQMNVWVAK